MSTDILYLYNSFTRGESPISLLNSTAELPVFYGVTSSQKATEAILSGKYTGLVVADYDLGEGDTCIPALIDARENEMPALFLSNGESETHRNQVKRLTDHVIPKTGAFHTLLTTKFPSPPVRNQRVYIRPDGKFIENRPSEN